MDYESPPNPPHYCLFEADPTCPRTLAEAPEAKGTGEIAAAAAERERRAGSEDEPSE